jgi:PKHD-type hydroxylase
MLNNSSEIEDTEIKTDRGDVVIFPSFIDHKVAPVTKGTRYSIVAWYGGPPFK